MGVMPKPAALHIARGNPSRKKASDLAAEPVVKSALTADNVHLERLSPARRALFLEIIRECPPGLLRSLDFAAVAHFAISVDLMLGAAERFSAENIVVKTNRSDRSEYKSNPFYRAYREAASDALRAAVEIGATPIARARMRQLILAGQIPGNPDAPEREDEDPWAQFAAPAA